VKRWACVIALLLPLAAGAAGWPKEPDRIFGLKLGEPVDAREVRACGQDADEHQAAITFCRSDFIGGAWAVQSFPIDEFREGFLSFDDGRAASLYVTAWHDDYLRVRALLLERYGKPTQSSVEAVRTKAGVPYKAERLVWRGKNVWLTLDEFSGKVDTTGITFSHAPTLLKKAERDSAQTKRDAAKF
jgi:hypothetical protein